MNDRIDSAHYWLLAHLPRAAVAWLYGMIAGVVIAVIGALVIGLAALIVQLIGVDAFVLGVIFLTVSGGIAMVFYNDLPERKRKDDAE